MPKINEYYSIDWIAKIGSDNAGCREHVMGPYDIGDRNDRGEHLLQFAQEKGMYISNTINQTSPAGSGLGYHREVVTEI